MESLTHSHGTIFPLGRILITSFSVLAKEFSSLFTYIRCSGPIQEILAFLLASSTRGLTSWRDLAYVETEKCWKERICPLPRPSCRENLVDVAQCALPKAVLSAIQSGSTAHSTELIVEVGEL